MKQGVFWVIPKGKNDFELLLVFDDTRGHSEIWEKVIYNLPELKKFDYEHFPRGRVWKGSGVATVFIDPRIKTAEVLAEVARAFALTDYKVFSDGT